MKASGLILIVALCLYGTAAAEEKGAAPPEIKLANSAPEVEFGVSLLIDTTPSANVHRMRWSVWPEKYEANLVEIAPGKTLFTCTLPGRYVFYGAASNATGELTTLRHSVRILPPGKELIEAMKADAEGLRATPAVYERPEPLRQAIQQPEAIPGLRGDLMGLLGKVQSHDRDNERPRVAAGYDTVGTELLAKRPETPEQALAIVSKALDQLDAPVRDKWRPFSQGVRERLTTLAGEGKLPGFADYVRACQVVEDVLADQVTGGTR